MENHDNSNVVKAGVAVGGALAAYQFLYRPYKIKQEMLAATQAETEANMAKGMSFADAHAAAVSGVCRAVGAFYKIPPDKSKSTCDGIGKLVTIATILGTKATIAVAKAAGKAVGKGAVVVGKGVATGAKGVASAVKFASYTAPKKLTVASAKAVAKGATSTAKAVKFASYTAPKKLTVASAKIVAKGATAAGKGVASAVKTASYTAPKKVTVASAKVVGKGATGIAKGVKVISYTAPKKVVTSVAESISHGFGLWGVDLGDDAATVSYMSGLGAHTHAAGMERAIRTARTNPLAHAGASMRPTRASASKGGKRPAGARPGPQAGVQARAGHTARRLQALRAPHAASAPQRQARAPQRRANPADVYLRYFG